MSATQNGLPRLDRRTARAELRRWEGELLDEDPAFDLGIRQALSGVTDNHEVEAVDLASDSLITRDDDTAEVAGTIYVELRLGGKSGVRLHEAFPIVLTGRVIGNNRLHFDAARVNIRSWTG